MGFVVEGGGAGRPVLVLAAHLVCLLTSVNLFIEDSSLPHLLKRVV